MTRRLARSLSLAVFGVAPAVSVALVACGETRGAPAQNASQQPAAAALEIATSPAPSAPLAIAAPAISASIPFCAYGGLGVMPAGVDGANYYRVIAYAVVKSPGAAKDVTLRALEIDGDAGVEATMTKLQGVERLPPTASLSPPGVWQSRGGAFDGTLAPGETRIRIEAWITRPPRSHPSTLRVELGSARDAPAVATCRLAIEWPT
jgi:hypothetical protein